MEEDGVMARLVDALRAQGLTADISHAGRWAEIEGERCKVYVIETADERGYHSWCDDAEERTVEYYREPDEAIRAGLRRAARWAALATGTATSITREPGGDRRPMAGAAGATHGERRPDAGVIARERPGRQNGASAGGQPAAWPAGGLDSRRARGDRLRGLALPLMLRTIDAEDDAEDGVRGLAAVTSR